MEWRDKMKVKELIKELESYNCPDAYIECRHGTLKYEIYDIFIDIKKEKCLIGLK